MLRAGFPEGAFQTLLIGAKQVEPIILDPRVAAATLTGSEGAGIEVGMGAAKHIKKVVLELGGSDPFIVMPSANLDEAVATAVKALHQQRAIPHRSQKIHRGRAHSDECERRCERHAGREDGRSHGRGDGVGAIGKRRSRRFAARGCRRPSEPERKCSLAKPVQGYWFDEDQHPQGFSGRMKSCSPAASLFRAKHLDDAIRIATTRFGLGERLTNDPIERERLTNELDSAWFSSIRWWRRISHPFGGVKHSGHGRELGVDGVREFTNIKTVWIEGKL
jgi:succinate-semialdehyde dehydrogenase/glutarate-semialdehyde dehydrogenase